MRISVATKAEDEPAVKRLKKGIIKVLRKFGGYEPEVDDIWVDEIATCTIYSKQTERFLDADTATEHTYSRVVDMRLKFQKMIENAMHHLAITRRDRIEIQGESDLKMKLREAIEKAEKT
jgi:hypothetical protein